MGRIKTKKIKSAGDDIYAKHADRFTADFVKNKEEVSKVAEVRSKKLRNILAGYLTKKSKLDV